MNEQLNDYTQKARQSGMTDEQIRGELIKAGWSITEIDSQFTLPTKPAHSKKRPLLWIIVACLIIVMAGGGYFAYASFVKTKIPAAPKEAIATGTANATDAPKATEEKPSMSAAAKAVYDKCIFQFTGSTPDSNVDAFKPVCYTQIAEELHDRTWCDRIDNAQSQSLCFAHIATSANDCEAIRNDESKNTCFDLMANKIGDTKICDKITDNVAYRTSKYGCYRSVAFAKGDSMICELITENKTEQAYCFSDVSISLRNVALCDRVVDTFDKVQNYNVTKDACKSFISELPNTTAGVELSTIITVPDNWKTYRNDKLGFEFRYPPEWTSPSIRADATPQQIAASENAVMIGELYDPQNPIYASGTFPDGRKTPEGVAVVVLKNANPDQFSTTAYFAKQKQPDEIHMIFYATVDGIDFYKQVTNPPTMPAIMFTRGKDLYTISDGLLFLGGPTQIKGRFNTIVSSFKFD
ncbi:hypothetical protein HY411_01965 [Candidatus Gottesmanbacteria bacterium]|nr:hypothetical protein [Candidatus Gottesmanbacteria bacterium]